MSSLLENEIMAKFANKLFSTRQKFYGFFKNEIKILNIDNKKESINASIQKKYCLEIAVFEIQEKK